MKKTRVTKLLAVVAMTTGAASASLADGAAPGAPANRPIAALAATTTTSPPAAPAPALVAHPVASFAAVADSALIAVRLLQQVSIELAKPRTMASGAPACGNVASRAPRPVSCEPRTEKP